MNAFIGCLIVPAAFVTLGGCASDIMRGYVGRAPEAVMSRYGPPDHVFDLPGGRRAYQWLEISQTTSSGSEETRTRWARPRNGRPPEQVVTTQIHPSTTQEQRCFYTMYAHREDSGWVLDDFERPELGC